jgi:predicted Ser/Thr protein kinase
MENQVLGHCRLLSKLGQGGMGVVWRARHETLQKDVAVKVLPQGFASEPEAVKRFLREARSAARLEHPNVVQVLDAGSADGVHFIVMQFVDGTDLEKIVKKRGRLAVGDALAVTKRVAMALGAAHKLGIIHRDIKPSNILVTSQSRVMVTDFGLAREIEGGGALTSADQLLGTPQYLSPEQARGEKLDGRSDLYSLGGTLYTLLTGRPPFEGATAVSIAVKHASAQEKPAPVRSIAPDVPAEVEALVEKLMAKSPQDRFQTADELAAAIDRVKGGEKGALVTVSREKVLTPQRRRRLLLTGGAITIGTLVLLGILLSPNKSERAYRAAQAARTVEEKVLLYLEVVRQFGGTEWAKKAEADARAILEADLAATQAAARDGKTPFRDVIARLDAARKLFPEEAALIDRAETPLHRERLVARTRAFGEALKSHKPLEADRTLDKVKDFIAPEAVRKLGEGGIRFWAGVSLGLFSEFGGRVEEVEVLDGNVAFENRKTAEVPVRAAVVHRVRKERTTQNVTIHWIWQEGDWYLAEKGVAPEKK